MRRYMMIAVLAAFLGVPAFCAGAQAPATPATKAPAAKAPATKALATKAPAARKRRPARKAHKAPPPAPVVPNEKRLADQVAEQLKIVERFLYAYGRVSNGLELATTDAARGQVSAAVAAKNKQHQAAVASNISGLWAGVDKVRASAEKQGSSRGTQLLLEAALGRIQDAERLAQAGKFDDAGKSLVTAAEQLTELLRELKVENVGG